MNRLYTLPKLNPQDRLNVYRMTGDGHFFLVECNAPLNVEDPPFVPGGHSAQLGGAFEALTFDDFTAELRNALPFGTSSDIVLFVHGFNTDVEGDAEKLHRARETFAGMSSVAGNAGNKVIIAFRWPSERLSGASVAGSLRTQPARTWVRMSLWTLLWAALGAFCLWVWRGLHWQILTGFLVLPGTLFFSLAALFTSLIAAVMLAAVLMRASCYYRDVYRATNYGIPDLVEMVRSVDKGLQAKGSAASREGRVGLSFVGHSLGSYIITGAVRILSDVFGAAQSNDETVGHIGSHLTLRRLVLAAADIPAEALMSGRGNFLRASLRRFEEAYLFTNEGDAILRLVSVIANFFSFPNRDSKRGYRLGNTIVQNRAAMGSTPRYGVWNNESTGTTEGFLQNIQVGDFSFHEQASGLTDVEKADSATDVVPAELFTFVDCTDYTENGTQYLSFGAQSPLGNRQMLRLLYAYFVGQLGGVKKWYRDIHGGYFTGAYTSRLIYGLAAYGFAVFCDSKHDGAAGFDADCRARRIRVLLSQPLQCLRSGKCDSKAR